MSDPKELLSNLTTTDINVTAHLIGTYVPNEACEYFEAMDRVYAAAGILAEQSPENAQAEAEERGITQYSRTAGIPQRQVETYWALVKDHAAGSDEWMEAVLTHGPLVRGYAEARAVDSALRTAIETAAGQLREERTAGLLAARERITSELAKLQQSHSTAPAEERPNAWSDRVRGMYLRIEAGFLIAVEDITGWVTEIEDGSRFVWVVTTNGNESPVITFPMEDGAPARKPAGTGSRVVPSFTEAILPYADKDGYIDPGTIDRDLWRMLDA